MRKAARHSDGMDSLNPHRWRDKRLHHHGGGVCWLFVLLWIELWHHELIVCKKWDKNNPKEGLCGVTFCPTLACTTPLVFPSIWHCWAPILSYQGIAAINPFEKQKVWGKGNNKNKEEFCNPMGVVHANVGKKLLNCYPLRVFSGDQKLRI